MSAVNTERLEEKLAESESWLRTIIETAPVCIKLLAVDGTLIEMNPAGLKIIEAESQDQVVGRQIHHLVVPAYREAFRELMKGVFKGETRNLEFELYTLKGSRRWMETRCAPLKNARGEITALLGVTRDVTERKIRGREVQRNYDTQFVINSLLQISLENIPLEKILQRAVDLILSIPWLTLESKGGIFLVEDDPGKLLLKAHNGLSESIQEECRMIPFGRCICGLAASTQEVQFADLVDERHEIHYKGITPHGHYCVPILFSGKTLGVINMYISEGHERNEKEVEFLKAIANVLAGIIHRKQLEEERERLIQDLRITLDKVSRSQKMWIETFDSIGDMISILDSDYNIVKGNRAFMEYFGLDPEKPINRKCFEFFHSSGSPMPDCPHLITLTENRAATAEICDTKTNRIFMMSTFPFNFHDAGFRGSIHIAKDITTEREKEMRLIMNERLAALGQMASGIAHEINNPLTAIMGCAEALLLKVKKGQFVPELFEEYLKIIEEEISRCKGITACMLSSVRKGAPGKKKIDVNEALDKTLEIIGFQGRLKDIEVRKEYGEMPTVLANEGELRQVFMIIMTNALEAMERPGILYLESGLDDGGVVIKIADSGPGIAEDVIDKIFDPFFTTKSESGGTGLGLSIAGKIIAGYKGAIQVESESGKGATFRITLPCNSNKGE